MVVKPHLHTWDSHTKITATTPPTQHQRNHLSPNHLLSSSLSNSMIISKNKTESFAMNKANREVCAQSWTYTPKHLFVRRTRNSQAAFSNRSPIFPNAHKVSLIQTRVHLGNKALKAHYSYNVLYRTRNITKSKNRIIHKGALQGSGILHKTPPFQTSTRPLTQHYLCERHQNYIISSNSIKTNQKSSHLRSYLNGSNKTSFSFAKPSHALYGIRSKILSTAV